jgi:cytochrome P450 family 6
MSYCLFELAKNPEIQRKVQKEIDGVLKSGKFTYESLHELKYLECCIDETLRKYPIVPLLMRECTEDYKIPDSDLVIPKGMGLMIPVLGFHRDPEIFENPMAFKPERFLNSPNGEGKAKGLFYLPFGDGPRNCIGMRLGKVLTKLGLAIVLSKYSIEFCDKTMADSELKFDTVQFILTPTKTFNLRVMPRTRE